MCPPLIPLDVGFYQIVLTKPHVGPYYLARMPRIRSTDASSDFGTAQLTVTLNGDDPLNPVQILPTQWVSYSGQWNGQAISVLLVVPG